MRLAPLHLAGLAFALALACNDHAASTQPSMTSFLYPTGLAVRHQPPGCAPGTAGCRTQLLVVSTNFDLRYDIHTGGTLLAVDVDQALAQAAAPGAPDPLPLTVLGGVQIGSFGGELVIADAETCPTWTGTPQALVASRSQLILYRVDIDDAGGLTCGEGCAVPLDTTFADAYGIGLACGTFPPQEGDAPTPQALAFVTYLRTPDSHGWVSRVDLLAASAAGVRTSPWADLDLQMSPAGHAQYDAGSARLYVTGRVADAGYTPLRWLELASPSTPVAAVDFASLLHDSDLRGMAISSDGKRGFVAVRYYDADLAMQYGGSPSFMNYNAGYGGYGYGAGYGGFGGYGGYGGMGTSYQYSYGYSGATTATTDLAGGLAVIDLTKLTPGAPSLSILRTVPLDRGPSEVRVIPRAGMGDLVVVSSTDDSTVAFYDDETGVVARTISFCTAGPSPSGCDPGSAALGANPFGMAVEPLASGLVRLYVGSFDASWVNILQIDPLHPEADPSLWLRLGPERPW